MYVDVGNRIIKLPEMRIPAIPAHLEDLEWLLGIPKPPIAALRWLHLALRAFFFPLKAVKTAIVILKHPWKMMLKIPENWYDKYDQ